MSFENIIEEYAAVKGVLCIKQNPEVMWIDAGKAKVTGTAWPDFVCSHQGLTFMFDAKSTRAKRAVNMRKSSLKNQWKDMSQFSLLVKGWEMGVVTFYLVRWVIHNEVEMYTVDSRSQWPFVCTRGKGICLGSDDWFDEMVVEVMKAYGRK
jgi:penicillin-binding protein-related factor A (putative recombinase)